MLKISKAIFRSLLSSRSLCVVVVALMVLCALPVFRSAAGIDGRVEYLESGITRVEQELSASYADALVNAGEDGVYTSSSSMPALLYPLAAGRLILAPLSPLLPFLQISDGEYTYYDGSKEYLLWVATAVAVSFLAARLNKREKLIIQAPMGELGRLVASSVWASVFAMLAVLAINLPGIIAALVKNGPGSPFYPIGYIQYATPVIKPAWLVFAQTAILQFLVAAFISLVVHLAVKIANNPTLGIVFVCALMGVTMVPGYYGRSGNSETFITEACEYTNSFLSFFPKISVILNMDADHLDFFKDIDDIRHSFRKFAELLPADGTLIINADTPEYETITRELPCNVLTYGLEHDADYTAADITWDKYGHPSFSVLFRGKKIGSYYLRVPGIHNVSNALAAIAVGRLLDLPNDVIVKGLGSFTGTDRRFQYKGEIGGITIIDDYAHHPTEIEATLHAAKIIRIRRYGVYSSLIPTHVPKLFFRNLQKR